MKHFVGIDLGTTNSAICSYNGIETRIWKSPEQNDVTPSVIYIDRRGNKYIGKRAYDSAPHSPNNAAMLFKRIMGTSTPVKISALDLTMTPEECSAEVLKVLYGYLPEEIRQHPETGVVITVPAAFNQMQKDATLQAATMAGLGKVALMQEPVAAVMSVMRSVNEDGIFLIYDLGGGTLDIAIAESIGGRISLLSHGGIAMCGGRDFDRVLLDNIVRPWLIENFHLPEDFSINPDYKTLMRLATWATERAKIELSANEETVISLSEMETRTRDLNGEEIYLDIPLQREIYNQLIMNRINESIAAARETLEKAGLSSHDLQRIVFVGGPTNYKPLRDKVSFELGVPSNTDVNPMTAVAEGASIFAESIDWQSENRGRKNTRGVVNADELGLSLNYISRTTNSRAKVIIELTKPSTEKIEYQIDNPQTGWTSGRLPLTHGTNIEVTLNQLGENYFQVSLFNQLGQKIHLENNQISITKTTATIDAIPASHSIGVEVLEKLGGSLILDYLIRAGDSLPKKGKKIFKAAETLKAGSERSLNIKLWEGEIENPISDNRSIGVLKISGSDFDDGVIPAGADLECDFEVLDSGNIILEVSVPCIGSTFHSGKNFYSRQEGQLDYTTAASAVTEEGEKTLERIEEIDQVVNDPKLQQAREKIESAISLNTNETETEKTQEAMEKVLEARKIIAQVRKDNLKDIRQIELDKVKQAFDEAISEHAQPNEIQNFNNLVKTAQRSIERNDSEFEKHLDSLRAKSFEILWKQDWFVIEKFNHMVISSHQFNNPQKFAELVNLGQEAILNDDIQKLRLVIIELTRIQIITGGNDESFDIANIIRS